MTKVTVSSFDPANNWFWEAIAGKVLELTGPGQTMWSGELHYMSEYDARPRSTADGTAVTTMGHTNSSGKVYLHRQEVVEPIDDMLRRGPESLNDREFALKVMRSIRFSAHEVGHLVAPAGMTREEFHLSSLRLPELSPIEEGFNESFSYETTPFLIEEALPPEYGSRLRQVWRDCPLEENSPEYPGWSNTAHAFAVAVGAELRLDSLEVRRVAAVADPAGKAPALAALIVDHTPGSVSLSGPERAAMVEGLGAGIQDRFVKLGVKVWDHRAGPLGTGLDLGQDAVRAARVGVGGGGLTAIRPGLEYRVDGAAVTRRELAAMRRLVDQVAPAGQANGNRPRPGGQGIGTPPAAGSQAIGKRPGLASPFRPKAPGDER